MTLALVIGSKKMILLIITMLCSNALPSSGASSELFKRECSLPLACACGCLFLTAAAAHVDDCCYALEKHRKHGPIGARKARADDEKHMMPTLFVTIFKCLPTLMLHAYILLVNQLSPAYAAHRIIGWGLVVQLISAFAAALSGTTGISGSLLSSHSGWSSVKKGTFSAVALFVAAFHGWLALALSLWALLTIASRVLLAKSMPGVSRVDAIGAGVSAALMGIVFSNAGLYDTVFIESFSKRVRLVLCVWESLIVTGLFVGLPFLLTPRGTVFEHGICSSLTQVSTSGNCIPRELFVVMLAWLGVNAVSVVLLPSL